MAKIKPDDFPWIAPYLAVADVAASLRFYQQAFDFQPVEAEGIRDASGELLHCNVAYQDTVFMVGKAGAFSGKSQSPAQSATYPAIGLFVYCEDVDSRYQQAISAGAVTESAPTDQDWGDRMCTLRDIDGYRWSFATQRQHTPSQ